MVTRKKSPPAGAGGRRHVIDVDTETLASIYRALRFYLREHGEGHDEDILARLCTSLSAMLAGRQLDGVVYDANGEPLLDLDAVNSDDVEH